MKPMFKVQKKSCSTCIYNKNCSLDIKELENQVKDRFGFFKGHRECHHAKRGSNVCCRGFWNRHKNDFPAGQIAQRLNVVQFVEVDIYETTNSAKNSKS